MYNILYIYAYKYMHILTHTLVFIARLACINATLSKNSISRLVSMQFLRSIFEGTLTQDAWLNFDESLETLVDLIYDQNINFVVDEIETSSDCVQKKKKKNI